MASLTHGSFQTYTKVEKHVIRCYVSITQYFLLEYSSYNRNWIIQSLPLSRSKTFSSFLKVTPYPLSSPPPPTHPYPQPLAIFFKLSLRTHRCLCILWFLIHCSHDCCYVQIIPYLASGSLVLSSWVLHPFDMLLVIFDNLLALWHNGMYEAHVVHFIIQICNQSFHQGVLSGRKIRDHDMGVKGAPHYWALPRSFHWARKEVYFQEVKNKL